MRKGWKIAAFLLLLLPQAADAQQSGPSERVKECSATVYPKGDYNPCDPAQCVKVCQCGGGADCFNTCERESKILFGPGSCRANIPADKLLKR